MPTKKKFIDKKNAVTFYLGHRSQQDPLIADETAPQRVLIPIKQHHSTADDGIPGTSTGRNENNQEFDTTKRKEEQQKYGIYFDDEYNYLQHIRDSKDVSNIEWDICERIYATDLKSNVKDNPTKTDTKDFKLKLPSSVFESEYVEDIGMLNKAASSRGPRPDLDPDIVAALDDDFDFENPENELEDNFMKLAGAGISDESEIVHRKITQDDTKGLFSSDEDEELDKQSDDDDTIESMDGSNFNESEAEAADENRSHFTSYSMSSSVVKRNEQLTLLDHRFEKLFQEYEETEIGPLDCDEIEGHLHPESDLLLKYAEEYAADKTKEKMLNQMILEMSVKEDDESSETLTEDGSSDENDDEKKWDCESILSTYSNTKNRPKLIKELSKRNLIKVSGKTGLPVGVLGSGLTSGNLKEFNNQLDAEDPGVSNPGGGGGSMASIASSIWLPRPKEETYEERLERKKRVKDYKRERRTEKKGNSEAFKEEKKRQVKIRLNCKGNVHGLKL